MPGPVRLQLPARPSAESSTSMEEPGQKLKRVRERLNLRYRDVEEASQKIAALHGSEEYTIVLSRLADIENKSGVPSIYRLYSLCAIYRLDPAEVLEWYGVDLSQLVADSSELPLERTHLIGFAASHYGSATVPLVLDPGLDMTQTTYLSRMIQRWGTIPLLMFNRTNPENHRYALVGTQDRSMYPLLQPGALVIIDESRRKIINGGWSTEFERPIYLLEHRSGYLVAWCNVEDERLIVSFHPASQLPPQVFAFPDGIDVVGQVTAVAMQLSSASGPESRQPRL